MNFAGVRLLPRRHACDLNVPTMWRILAQFHNQISLHNLHVIEVHLHFQIRGADLSDDGVRLSLRIQKKIPVCRAC